MHLTAGCGYHLKTKGNEATKTEGNEAATSAALACSLAHRHTALMPTSCRTAGANEEEGPRYTRPGIISTGKQLRSWRKL